MKQILLFFFCTLITASTNPIIAQPGGTSCASAVAVTPGDYQCDHAGGVDQWYSYTAPEEQKVTASTCGLTSENTYLELYSSCANLMAYGESCGGQAFRTKVLKAGETIYYRWVDNGGSYTWRLTTEPLTAGDNCDLAKEAVLGQNTADYTDGWYDSFKYTAPASGTLRASTCGLTDVDTYVEIGELCGAALASSDNDCGGQSSVEIPVVAGQAYGITWRSKSGLTSFPWTLSITTDIVDVSSQSNVIIVYPNPNDGNFTISSNSKENFKSVEILTTTGILVTTLNAEIECSHTYSVKLQSGIYIVRITLENNSKLSTKLIVK